MLEVPYIIPLEKKMFPSLFENVVQAISWPGTCLTILSFHRLFLNFLTHSTYGLPIANQWVVDVHNGPRYPLACICPYLLYSNNF